MKRPTFYVPKNIVNSVQKFMGSSAHVEAVRKVPCYIDEVSCLTHEERLTSINESLSRIGRFDKMIVKEEDMKEAKLSASDAIARQEEWYRTMSRTLVPRIEVFQELAVSDLFAFVMKNPPRTMKREEWYQMQHFLRFARWKVSEKIKALDVTGHYERLALYGQSMLEIVA